ncbi:NHL repeat-containing protein [Streptomyces sp. NPDC048504]|uniref:NHL repeat-containing protein n=1 Tax=Streptomyces sp. NPDC048504 TaxID=3365559 RepID=UPI003711800C
MIRILGDPLRLLTPGPTVLPMETLATGRIPAWELGRRLTVPGRVRRGPLDGSGFRCAFVTARGAVAAVHGERGLEILAHRGTPAARAPDVRWATATPDGMLLTTPAGIELRRPDGTRTPLLAADDLPDPLRPPSSAGLLASGDLVLALPHLGEVVVVTPEGRVLSRLGAEHGLDEPVGVCVDPDGTGFLIADARAHVVLHASAGAHPPSVRRVHGQPGRAGKGPRLLNAPRYASFTRSGSVLVADTKNNRVLDLAGGTVVRTWGRTDAHTESTPRLWHPHTATQRPDGSVLVAEGRGNRVLSLGDPGTLTVLRGRCDMAATELIQPRGAHFTGPGRVLVADCHNDRVLEVTPTGKVTRVLPGGATADGTLDWPRFALALPDGTLVADGRRGRLLFLDATGTSRRQLTAWRTRDERRPFVDPHHAVVTSEAPLELLVTDSGAGTVCRIDRSGLATWWHTGLSDPHMALPLPDGGVLVCDTGADRLLRISRDGRHTVRLDAERVRAHTGTPMRQPRAMARLKSGALLVVDTGGHRVLLVRPDGRVRSLSPVLDRLVGSLFFPRHVAVDADERTVVLSDFDNSRLVFVDLPALLEVSDGRAVDR